jgi:hypothetical protein
MLPPLGKKKETYRTASQCKAYDRLVAITKIKPESIDRPSRMRSKAVKMN